MRSHASSTVASKLRPECPECLRDLGHPLDLDLDLDLDRDRLLLLHSRGDLDRDRELLSPEDSLESSSLNRDLCMSPSSLSMIELREIWNNEEDEYNLKISREPRQFKDKIDSHSLTHSV